MSTLKKTEDLMSVADAMKTFRLGRATIFRAIADGRLTRHGQELGDRRTFVSRTEIKALMTRKPEEGKR